ncbi:hypothetical protein ACFFIX_19375 [Metabacillus herbersteinensis]|uniref:Uncharacterized protein n=1 Tax=Metabacillus herbersteinensis TaxID=283816 RepID=A0ABV6GIN9_9BACI
MDNHTLANLAKSVMSYKVLLTEVTPMKGMEPQKLATSLGLASYPLNSDMSSKVYRVVGIDGQHLDCQSTKLIATSLHPEPTELKCENEKVFSLLIPKSDNVPFVELSWHHSLLQRITHGNVGSLVDYTEYNKIINRRSNVYTDVWLEYESRNVGNKHEFIADQILGNETHTKLLDTFSPQIHRVQLRYDINGVEHKSRIWVHPEYFPNLIWENTPEEGFAPKGGIRID